MSLLCVAWRELHDSYKYEEIVELLRRGTAAQTVARMMYGCGWNTARRSRDRFHKPAEYLKILYCTKQQSKRRLLFVF